jgi:hypothetical protein
MLRCVVPCSGRIRSIARRCSWYVVPRGGPWREDSGHRLLGSGRLAVCGFRRMLAVVYRSLDTAIAQVEIERAQLPQS